MHFKIHPAPKLLEIHTDGIELLLNQFKILDCTLEGKFGKAEGDMGNGRRPLTQKNGELPALRVVGVMIGS
jgi:hypothetical protein